MTTPTFVIANSTAPQVITSNTTFVLQASLSTGSNAAINIGAFQTNIAVILDGGSVANPLDAGIGIFASSSFTLFVSGNSSLLSSGAGVLGGNAANLNATNYGVIQGFGLAFGIQLSSSSGTNVIHNYGTIAGAVAYYCPNAVSIIDNWGDLRALTAASSAAALSSAADTLNNYGTIFGEVSLGAGTDYLFNSGAMRGDVTIHGTGGDKTIVNAGLIQSTTSGFAIALSGIGFDAVTNAGTIVGNVDLGPGDDFFDSRMGTVTGNVSGGDGGDFIYGSRFDDTLNGQGDNDFLLGGDGNDTLNGGSGSDSMSGGNGNDLYLVDQSSDIVSEGVGQGTNDAVLAFADFTLQAGVEVETLTAAGLNLILTGNAFAQTITGSGGADTLAGGGGGDTLIGLLGNDIYVLGAEATGVDTVIDSGGTADTITTLITRSLASYAAIENLTLLGTVAIIGTGNALANTITGNDGNNLLAGGLGADTLNGLLGNDTYVLENGSDAVADSGGTDTITSTINRSLAGFAAIENLTLLGSAAVGTGNNLANVITGDAIANTLSGGIGNDTLVGGLGNDRLTGGANNDFFVFNTALNAAANRDTITDFNHVNDTFRLENAIFTKLGAGIHALSPAFFHAGAVAADANDYIVYNQATGVLSYDVNGNAAGGVAAFAFLANHPVLAANDFLVI